MADETNALAVLRGIVALSDMLAILAEADQSDSVLAEIAVTHEADLIALRDDILRAITDGGI